MIKLPLNLEAEIQILNGKYWRYGQEDSDDDEIEAIEEDHAPDMNVSMPQNEKENLKLAVQEVQSSVPVTEVIDDALCSLCNKRTFLPLVYHENLVEG